MMWQYESNPGAAATAPPSWPADSRLRRSAAGPTLVMLLHPRCPCSRSSIGELARLMARCHGRVSAHVLFVKPAGVPDQWERTDLWRRASAIPSVEPFCDDAATEARRFHAQTSGQTLLYDANGRLRFNGGITGSRGHAGDNAGLDALVSLINEGSADVDQTFVFGCELEPAAAIDPTPK